MMRHPTLLFVARFGCGDLNLFIDLDRVEIYCLAADIDANSTASAVFPEAVGPAMA